MSLKLRRKLSESGRSLVLRIPRDVERILSLKSGDEVDLWVEDGRMIIETVRRRIW
jgi:antitoxin component of MazEF toxin-antitoxin module